MDEVGNGADDPLSSRNTYSGQQSSQQNDRRQSEPERPLPVQQLHQQTSRTLTVPAQLAAAFPTWTREAADTFFGLLGDRGDQAAAISEAFSGVTFPAALTGAGRSALSPQGVQQQSHQQLQQASAILQHQQLQGLQRRIDEQANSGLPSETAGSEAHSLLAQYQLQAQQLAAPRYALVLLFSASLLQDGNATCLQMQTKVETKHRTNRTT